VTLTGSGPSSRSWQTVAVLRRPTVRLVTRLVILLVVLLGGAQLLAGCAAASSVLDDIAPSNLPTQTPVQVSGSAGEPPVLDYPTPYDVTRPGSRTVWPGTGEPVAEGEPVLLNMYGEDGRDRSVIQSTFFDAPAWFTMTEDSLGTNLYDSLRGQRVGARVLVVEENDGVPVVLVVDVMPTRASGTEVPSRKGLPTVQRAEGGEPYVRIPESGRPPSDLEVQPLVRGTGPQVRVGQVITVRFTGVRWSDGKVFDTTWQPGMAPQSATIGIGQLIDGWDQGLLEQTVGSQVLLVVPPHLGYGGTSSELADETLVYVVDILDAHFQVTEETGGGEDGGKEESKKQTESSEG
jgi:peptidylprolyl isomerase